MIPRRDEPRRMLDGRPIVGPEQGQPEELEPLAAVVGDMVDEAARERPSRENESRENFERAGRKENDG